MIKFDTSILENILTIDFPIDSFEVSNIKIGSHFSVIDFFEINDIYIIKPELKGYDAENSNSTIKERLEQLSVCDGWVHLAGGLAIKIKNTLISRICFRKKYLEPIKNYDEEKIVNQLGKPELEFISETFWDEEGTIDAYIFVYKNGLLNIFFEPDTLKIKELQIGELDKSNYTLKK